MLTKIEMEDIWNNKPVDYLKDFMKKNKKLSLVNDFFFPWYKCTLFQRHFFFGGACWNVLNLKG